MAPNTEPTIDTRSPDEVERDLRALDFILNEDDTITDYTETHTVFGRFAMTFRTLSAGELIQADAVANAIDSESVGARSIEREVMWITAALVAIGKKDTEPAPITRFKNIEEKATWISTWPYSLLSDAVAKYLQVEKNFREICNPDAIKNLQGEPGTSTV